MNHHQIKINESASLVDSIVKEVLFRLGECEKIYLIKGCTYPQGWLDKMTQCHLLKWCDAEVFEDLKKSNNMRICLPELTIKQMMAVINASPIDQVSEILFRALIHGVSISVFEETVEILDSTLVKTLLTDRFYKSYDLLIRSGLKVQKIKPTPEIETQECLSIQEANSPKAITFKNRVLTENQLIAYKEQGIESLVLEQETLLTPSAMDFIRMNAINIDRK